MRQRAFIHVAGPPGAGKTTFIEALLSGANMLTIAARCVRNDTRRRPQETAPANHPELLRYREAGASGAALFVFPGSAIGSSAFFNTDLMTDYSQAVVVEGDSPLEFADLRAFVSPAPEAGESLFVRGAGNRAAAERAAHALEFFGEPVWPKGLLGATQKPRWEIAGRYAGIELAGLVIVNVRSDTERRLGEQLVADVTRIRRDKDLFNDILRFRGNRLPVTAVVANLADPDDPSPKKAIQRVRRTLRSAAPRG